MYFVSYFCCLCLNENDLSEIDVETDLYKKLLSVVKEVSEIPEEIPKFVCKTCSGKLNAFVDFQNGCKSNVRKFRGYVSQLEDGNINIENENKAENNEYVAVPAAGAASNTDQSGNIFPCNICHKRCISKRSFAAHIQMHNNTFKCNECNRSFGTRYNLKRHTLAHPGSKEWKCTLCLYKCKEKSALQKHMKLHTESANKRIRHNCVACRAIRKTKSMKRPFMCTVCVKWFPVEECLQMHSRLFHKNKK